MRIVLNGICEEKLLSIYITSQGYINLFLKGIRTVHAYLHISEKSSKNQMCSVYSFIFIEDEVKLPTMNHFMTLENMYMFTKLYLLRHAHYTLRKK